ncbi:hypothetical protein ACFXJ5_09240 [Streptomyces sp. NPDC059373]
MTNASQLVSAAYAAQLEIVRCMPVAGRHRVVLTGAGEHAGAQSVQDSAAVYQAVVGLRAHELPAGLAMLVERALVEIEALLDLRADWMRHRPNVEEQRGVSGMTLLQRVERRQVPGVDPVGAWARALEAEVAMQAATGPLHLLNLALEAVTGRDLSEALRP